MKTKQYAGLNIAYGYNGLNQLTQLTGDAGKFTFNHDAFTGALQRQVFPNGVETSYQRNLAGELLGINTQKGSNKILNYALTLDQNGRRKTIQAEQPQGIQQTAENLQFTFTLKGIIDQLNGKKVTYDQRGNITNIPAPFDHAYGYDGLDRVTSSNGIQHQYDDSRRRIAKIKDGKTTNYQWDTSTPFDDVIAEYDGKTLKKRYLYGARGLLAQIDADGTAHYVHQDFNHNVVALSNVSGSVSDSFAFSPYGRSAGRTGTTDIPFGFAGGVGVMTDSADNIYMRARHYHTGLRQFTSPDLIEGNLLRPQSLNRYAYVEGMVFSGVDPSGLEENDEFSRIKNVLIVAQIGANKYISKKFRVSKKSLSSLRGGINKIEAMIKVRHILNNGSVNYRIAAGSKAIYLKRAGIIVNVSSKANLFITGYLEQAESVKMFEDDYEQIESGGGFTLAGTSIASAMDSISYGSVRGILKIPKLADSFSEWDSTNYTNYINNHVNSAFVYDFISNGGIGDSFFDITITNNSAIQILRHDFQLVR